MKKIVFALSLFLFCVLAACHKDHETIITISEPTDGQVLTAGQKLHLDFSIDAGDGEVHEYAAKITNKTDGTEAWSKEEHNHDHIVEIHEEITLTVTASSNFELEVTQTDHDGKATTKKVSFSVNL